MAVIRITEPMADTILAAVKREGGVYVVRGRLQTENALADRGLIQAEDDYLKLTPAGQWVLGYLQTGATRRAWTVDEIHAKSAALHNETTRAPKLTAADLPAGTRVQHADGRTGAAKGYWEGRVTIPDHENFGREFTGVEWDATDRRPWPEAARPFVDELTIVSLPELPGPKAVGDVMVPPAEAFEKAPTLEDVEFDSDEADRAQARREESTVECECGAQWPTGVMGEGHNDMDCTTASQRMAPEVTEYSVKIWYRSGAYEGAPHCPEELARQIFADAVQSAGVEFAELHGPSGMLVESKPRTEENPVTTDPQPVREYPEENLFMSGLPQVDPALVAPAPEVPQEPEQTA